MDLSLHWTVFTRPTNRAPIGIAYEDRRAPFPATLPTVGVLVAQGGALLRCFPQMAWKVWGCCASRNEHTGFPGLGRLHRVPAFAQDVRLRGGVISHAR